MQIGVFNTSDYSQHPSILGFRLFSFVVRNHMAINKRIINRVSALLSPYSGRPFVGLHLRMSNRLSDFREKYICENFLYDNDVDAIQECKYINYQQQPVIYVASDSSIVKEKINVMLNTTVIMHNATSFHTDHKMSSDNKRLAYESVLYDIVVLSKCDVLIVTKGSSLSYLAAAYQGSVPYYVSRNKTCYYPHSLTTLTPSHPLF